MKLHLYRKLASTFKKIIFYFINVHLHIMVAKLKYICRETVVTAKLVFKIVEY